MFRKRHEHDYKVVGVEHEKVVLTGGFPAEWATVIKRVCQCSEPASNVVAGTWAIEQAMGNRDMTAVERIEFETMIGQAAERVRPAMAAVSALEARPRITPRLVPHASASARPCTDPQCPYCNPAKPA